jgi:hypothetical protein
MRIPLTFSLALVLGACAGGPAVPDWQANAKSSTDAAVTAYLSGNDRTDAQEFARARSETSGTGQFTLVARVELIRCASRVASLVFDDCPAFEKLRQDAGAPERAYADYLAGRIQAQDIGLLPQQHRGVANAAAGSAGDALASIDDPFSRLVAAGVLLRSGRADPKVIALAIDTASNQGWRRPLLAWLGVQTMRAEQAGDQLEVQRLRRRMALVQEAKP